MMAGNRSFKVSRTALSLLRSALVRTLTVATLCTWAMCIAAPAAWARTVDIDMLTRDLQLHRTGETAIRTAFWIAPDFVEVGLDDPESAKDKKLMAVFDNHAVFLVSNVGVNANGVPYARSAAEVRGGTQLSINGAAKLLALSERDMSDELKSGLEATRLLLQDMRGPQADQTHLVVFRLPEKPGFPALYAGGKELVKLTVLGEEFSWRLPLGGVLPPVVDKQTGEQFPGNFLFSPFSGRALVPVNADGKQAGQHPSYSSSYAIGANAVADSEVNSYLAHAIATESRMLGSGAPPAQPMRLLKGGPPSMPPEAIDRKIEGTVHVELQFDESGGVEDIKILSTPHEVLSAAVIAAVSNWRIERRVQDGKPTKLRTRQMFTFAAP